MISLYLQKEDMDHLFSSRKRRITSRPALFQLSRLSTVSSAAYEDQFAVKNAGKAIQWSRHCLSSKKRSLIQLTDPRTLRSLLGAIPSAKAFVLAETGQ